MHGLMEKTDVSASDLRERFGPRITELVLAVSDDDRIAAGYAKRRAALRRQVSGAGDEALTLFAADKLSKAGARGDPGGGVLTPLVTPAADQARSIGPMSRNSGARLARHAVASIHCGRPGSINRDRVPPKKPRAGSALAPVSRAVDHESWKRQRRELVYSIPGEQPRFHPGHQHGKLLPLSVRQVAPAPSTYPDELDEPVALLPVQPHDVITSERRKLSGNEQHEHRHTPQPGHPTHCATE
jgi:hypothetical protein